MYTKDLRSSVIAALILLGCLSAASFAGPKIEFTTESVDFGKALVGSIVTVKFEFKNAGDADLEITRVQPGCGCTRAEAKETKLAPGKSSTLEAELNTAGYSGKVSKTVTVYTNDPDRKAIVLRFSGELVQLAKLKPERLNFGQLKANTTRIRTVYVYPGDPKTFEIGTVTSSGKQVSVGAPRRLLDRALVLWELPITIEAGPSAGPLRETLVIASKADPNARTSLIVYGEIVE